jgi:hypothetical protein
VANTTGFKARVEYEVTDGTQKAYTFPFSYLRKKFVMVSILHSDASETALEYGVDYTVNDLSVSLTTPAQVGEHIIIYRQTSTDKIVTWNDGSILLARDMNTEDAQMLHLQEEQQDYIMAHAISTKVTSDKEVLWDALNHRVINVSDPKDPQDAVTKNYMETVQGGFVAANTILVQEATKQASAAKSSQEAAKTSETNANTSETNSEISHQKAKKWAEATDSPDGEGDTDSTTGKTQSSKEWALYSKTKAQEAATSATNAKGSETNAKTSETNAKTSETKVAVSEANAKTSETNAKSSETKAKDSENAARVSEQNAAESARVATENAMDFNMLKRNKAYSIGDIAYSSYLPSWARLECVTAGTTAATVPFSLIMVSRVGLLISDGTVTWIVDDVRDGNRVGDIVLKPTLNDGYIKANGATVKASEYPRLLKFAQDNSLCVSDSEWSANSATKYVYDASADTLKVPNAMGRVLQGEDALATKQAGLPNIQGQLSAAGAPAWQTGSGAFYLGANTSPEPLANVEGARQYTWLYFSANLSNSIYGASDTVQPPACCLIAQIKY